MLSEFHVLSPSVLLPTPTVYFTKTEYIFRMKNADDIQREGKVQMTYKEKEKEMQMGVVLAQW